MNIFQKRTVGKKGIAAALLASQLLFTAGCGSGEQRETAGQLDTEQTMQQDGYIVVGYVQVGSESDWRTTNTQSFKDVFTQENGYYLIFEDGQQKQENQDRELFDEILEKTKIPRAAGGTVFTAEEAKEVANRLGYPVLVRPSYVLGGQGMKIAFNDDEIEEFIGIINRIAQDHPILVDKYLQGKEIEVDAVCDGTDILIPGIMEHIERTGGHSGDSISVYPAPTISDHVKETIVEYTKRLAQALHVIGLINIQFIAMNEEVYVVEVNPRSSRTVPYISKVTGIPIVDLATKFVPRNPNAIPASSV